MTARDSNARSDSALQDAPWLNLVPQFSWHGEARIIATPKGLEELQAALNDAMMEGAGIAEVFASDGEGYRILIERTDMVDGLGNPYYGDEIGREIARDEREYYAKFYAPKRAKLTEPPLPHTPRGVSA